MFNVFRVRKIERIIESPTTASAAATTMIKKMKITPVMESILLAKVTNDKLTAFSISSILMKIIITLRLSITPNTPNVKRTALNNKMCSMGIIKRVSLKTTFCNHYRTNYGNKQENSNNFKCQNVIGKEQTANQCN